eukprot:93089_1
MSTDIIKSAAKFLQTPAKPERPLEEKIRFLIKEKKLTQYQLIAALKQANLYNIETIEPILTMCYYEQNTLKKNSKKIAPPKSKPSQPPYNQPSNPQQQPVSSWSPWWSTVATIGMGVTSFIASYTVSTTVSQNLLKKSEEKVSSQLEAVKTEIKEQADLDRERQHRDLMEVVNLLKTQVSCVQQNLGVLKQSIEVIQTQMKFNINDPHNTSIMLQNKNIRGSTGDDGSVISSGMSNSNNENKPNLNVIGNLLSQNDDGLDWLNSKIVTSNDNDNDDEKKMENNNYDNYKVIGKKCIIPGKINVNIDQKSFDNFINSFVTINCDDITKDWKMAQMYWEYTRTPISFDKTFSDAYYTFNDNDKSAVKKGGSWPSVKILPPVSDINTTVTFIISGYGWYGIGDDQTVVDGFAGYHHKEFAALNPKHGNMADKVVQMSFDVSNRKLTITIDNQQHISQPLDIDVKNNMYFLMTGSKVALIE